MLKAINSNLAENKTVQNYQAILYVTIHPHAILYGNYTCIYDLVHFTITKIAINLHGDKLVY